MDRHKLRTNIISKKILIFLQYKCERCAGRMTGQILLSLVDMTINDYAGNNDIFL